MKKVSNAYNPYTSARKVDCEVTFEAINKTAQENASIYAFLPSNISNISQLTNGSRAQKTFASCEPNATLLNGKYSFLPDNLADYEIGYISKNTSDINGENSKATLIVSFPQPVTLSGFTIFFEPENYATEIAFSTLDSDKNVSVAEIIKNNSGVCNVEIPLINISRVSMVFTKTRYPNTHIRVSEVTCGVVKEWNKKNIISAEFENSADIYSEAFPSAIATITVNNAGGEYNSINRIAKYIDLPIQSKVTFTSEGAASFSQISQLSDNVKVFPTKYASCEPFETMLDGSYHFLPDTITNNQKTGFTSAQITDKKGDFVTPPKITASFPSAQEHSGFKIYFADYFSAEIKVTLYSGANIIISEIIHNAKKTAEINLGAENYDKVIFEFLNTNVPEKGLRISEIDFMKSAESWIKYLTEDNPISAALVINGEKIKVSNKNLFFKEFSADDNNMNATFSFCDRAENLDNIVAKATKNGKGSGYIINTVNGNKITISAGKTTLKSAVENILNTTGISAKYENGIENRDVYMYISDEISLREIIRKLAQAAMCICWIDLDGVLNFGEIKRGIVCDTINGENRYYWSGEKLANYVDCVILNTTRGENEGSITAGSGKNSVTVDNEFVSSAQAVANWLLGLYKKRSCFEIDTRGNPAIDIGDTVSIQDISREYQLAEIYDTDYYYDGGLKSTIKAVKSV